MRHGLAASCTLRGPWLFCVQNLREASHKLTTSSSLRHLSPALVLGGGLYHRYGRLGRLVLSIGLVCALVTGSALLRVRQELFDKPSEQRLRVAASHLSHGDCVTSADHRRRAHFALLGLRLRHGCLSRCAQQLQCRRRPPSSGGTANGRWCPRACRKCRSRVVPSHVAYRQIKNHVTRPFYAKSHRT